MMIFASLLAMLATVSITPHSMQEKREPTVSFSVGPNSIVDRGYGEYVEGETYFEPANYRYWTEQMGECLYIYDNTGTLKGRIVNPVKVVIR
jgi:hypothetical protein